MEKETFHSRNSLRATRETPRRKSRRRPRRLSEDDLWISANCLYNFSYIFFVKHIITCGYMKAKQPKQEQESIHTLLEFIFTSRVCPLICLALLLLPAPKSVGFSGNFETGQTRFFTPWKMNVSVVLCKQIPAALARFPLLRSAFWPR
jgi:hypothetical protein